MFKSTKNVGTVREGGFLIMTKIYKTLRIFLRVCLNVLAAFAVFFAAFVVSLITSRAVAFAAIFFSGPFSRSGYFWFIRRRHFGRFFSNLAIFVFNF